MREFRQATEADLDNLVAVAMGSFPVPDRSAEIYRRWISESVWADWDDIWIVEEDGEHVAQAFLYPFTMHAWGSLWRTGGLGGVAVRHDARRRGLARDLVKRCQSICVEKGWPWMTLYPFRVDYYRTLGWGLVESRDQFRVRSHTIPRDPGAARVRIVNLDALDELHPVYEAFAARRNGFLQRDPTSWRRRLDRQPPFLAAYEGPNGVEGYIVYTIEALPQDHESQKLLIEELVWMSDPAFRGLWGFVASMSDQIAEVAYTARENDGFLHLVSDPRVPGGRPIMGPICELSRRCGGLMAKVLNNRAVIEGRRFAHGTGRLRVRVTDPLTDTADSFALTIEDGRGQFEDDAECPETLTADSGTWAQLLCGAISLKTARRLGRVEGTINIPHWETLLATGTWSIFEGF